jgi:hypothetical protein
MSKRCTHSPECKAKVATEAISGRKTLQEIAADNTMAPLYAAHLRVRPIQVSHWKRQRGARHPDLRKHCNTKRRNNQAGCNDKANSRSSCDPVVEEWVSSNQQFLVKPWRIPSEENAPGL